MSICHQMSLTERTSQRVTYVEDGSKEPAAKKTPSLHNKGADWHIGELSSDECLAGPVDKIKQIRSGKGHAAGTKSPNKPGNKGPFPLWKDLSDAVEIVSQELKVHLTRVAYARGAFCCDLHEGE